MMATHAEIEAILSELRTAMAHCEQKRDAFNAAHTVMTNALTELHEAESFANFVQSRFHRCLLQDALQAIGHEAPEDADPLFGTNLRDAWRTLSGRSLPVGVDQ